MFLEPGEEMQRCLMAVLERAVNGVCWVLEVCFGEVGVELAERWAGAVVADGRFILSTLRPLTY